jgi:PiT family inorganic phosphate transporter
MEITLFVISTIGIALLFDFLNGFHDAANAIATVVVTKTLRPQHAVLMAGAANFVGYFIFGVAVATTIGTGIVDSSVVTLPIIFAALVGAIAWNILTWLFGLPTSSSHALIGGLVGSAIVAVGMSAVLVDGLLKVFAFIFIAPLLGGLGALLFTILVLRASPKRGRARTNKAFKRLQLVSAAIYSIGHGTNDAQKTMGVIALVLFSAGVNSSFVVEDWVVFSCYAAITLGTIFGGWRIVKTMGTNIMKIRPMEGFCSETSSAAVLVGTAHFGIPVSTTHVIAGAIMGVGTAERGRRVRWVTARKIIWAWMLTIPATAAFGAVAYLVVQPFV